MRARDDGDSRKEIGIVWKTWVRLVRLVRCKVDLGDRRGLHVDSNMESK